MAKNPITVAGNQYGQSEFWRELSWRVGDIHANRICWLLEWYCRLFKVERRKFYSRVPQG